MYKWYCHVMQSGDSVQQNMLSNLLIYMKVYSKGTSGKV